MKVLLLETSFCFDSEIFVQFKREKNSKFDSNNLQLYISYSCDLVRIEWLRVESQGGT